MNRNKDIQHGGCQCGAVRYETTENPVRVIACHCKTCKQRTGAPYGVGVYLAEENVEFNEGKLETFEFFSSESGRWLRNQFCPVCGASVCWTLELRPGLVGIAGGTYDNPDWFKIQAHIWTESARSDMVYPDDVAVHEKAMPPA
jgi:hypothetical protein